MYDQLKMKYEKNYITLETLKGWVLINKKKPGRGITDVEYKQITGKDYDAQL